MKKQASIGMLWHMQTTTKPMDASKQFCPNETCTARGKIGEGNIRIHSHQPQRYRCLTCKKTFSARRGTMMEGLRRPTELVVVVVILLSYGCPIQAIVHAYGLDERTVADWQKRAGKHCQLVHHALVEQGKIKAHHIQADEIRAKGRKMIAWMGLCAVSVHMKFLRNAGEGESKTSRTPNLPGVETQRKK
ncbi:MAG: transposase [Ktedonobacteraceae bacterium]